jgi:hypothetical protein
LITRETAVLGNPKFENKTTVPKLSKGAVSRNRRIFSVVIIMLQISAFVDSHDSIGILGIVGVAFVGVGSLRRRTA